MAVMAISVLEFEPSRIGLDWVGISRLGKREEEWTGVEC
jgi:hypothetical protein